MSTHYFGTLENTLAAGFRRSLRKSQISTTLIRQYDLEALYGAFLMRFFSKEEGNSFFASAEVAKDTFEIVCNSFAVMDGEVLVVLEEPNVDSLAPLSTAKWVQERVNKGLQIIRKELSNK